MSKKRVLFLLSDTGGGHRSAAQAITEGLQRLYPGQYQAIMDDLWQEHTPWPINQLPKSYPWLAGPGLPLWKFMWYISISGRIHPPIFRIALSVVQQQVATYFKATQPDIIVCVHPWLNEIGFAVKEKIGLNIPYLTVVTDMVSIHPTWVCPEVTHCTVPTAMARERAIRFGLSSNKISLTGQPVSPRFADMQGCNKVMLRHLLSLEPDLPTILLISGGEGQGDITKVAQTLAQLPIPLQLLIVTGRNQTLQQSLTEINWPIPTHIYGFVSHIPELMGCADILITKAGPSTISEAMISGLPMILFDYIPGQESGNVTFVEKHGIGVYAPQPAQIGQLVMKWLGQNKVHLQKMAHQAAVLAKPSAAQTIAQHIHQYTGGQNLLCQPQSRLWTPFYSHV